MKKYIEYITALFAVLALAACSDDKEPAFVPASFELTPGEGAAVTIAPDGTTGSVRFSYEKDSVTIQVKTNQEDWQYTVEQPAEHFSITREGDKLTIAVPENKTSLPYKATITLNTGTESNFASCVLSLSQDPTPDPEITIEPGSVMFPAEGGEAELTVTTNREHWTVRKLEDTSTDNFMFISKIDGKVMVMARENRTPLVLNGTLVVTSGEGENTIEAEIPVTQEAAPRIKVNVNKSTLNFTSEGGEETIAVTAENVGDWNFSCNDKWLKVERQGNNLIVTAPVNHSANTPSAKILVYAGDKNYNYDERTITVQQEGWENAGALVFELTIPEPQDGGVTALLPLVGLTNCSIDWGDGSEIDHPTEKIPSHVYAAAGVYQVAVKGGVERIFSQDSKFTYPYREAKDYITAVLNWGNTALNSMEKAFYNLQNLKSIPDDTEGAFSGVTTFYNAFSGCAALESIPAGLFTHAKIATDFTSCFQDCEAVKTIPAGLFANCESAEKFYGTFYSCGELLSVPDELFAGHSKVTAFTRLFGYCSNLESVGKDVFKGCTENTSFNQIFIGCGKLESVPVDIFDDCRKVTDFRFAFRYGSSLKGESPYTLIDGKKVHLYERNSYLSHFSEVSTYQNCFSGCTGLSDYDAIVESGWN